jgi:hypothetical protein
MPHRRQGKFNHVFAAERGNELAGRAERDQPSPVYYRNAVTKALSFIHVVSCNQDGAPFFSKFSYDFPKLAP